MGLPRNSVIRVFFVCTFITFPIYNLTSEALYAKAYRKSTEGKDVVKRKLYPKRKKIELSVPNAGMILNQSYINTMMVNVGINYFFSETWGIGFDYSMAMNEDKDERECIENFYNDPNERVTEACGGPGGLDEDGTGAANFGPAYVPIREIQNIMTVNALWNPIYGKALMLLSNTIYFDLYFELGLGLVNSEYYPKQEILANGNKSRGQFNPDGSQPTPPLGAGGGEVDSYGEAGRPAVETQSNVLVNLAIGQKFHFKDRFHIKVFLRNHILVGTEPNGFDTLLAMYVGAGMRL